jgi:hypothetical protein
MCGVIAMSILTVNLKQLYQRRGLWLAHVMPPEDICRAVVAWHSRGRL